MKIILKERRIVFFLMPVFSHVVIISGNTFTPNGSKGNVS